MATEAAQALDAEWVDWPVVTWERVEQDGGQYREMIVTGRQWLNRVVRSGPDADAARAAAVLLAAGNVNAATRTALAERFPQGIDGQAAA